MSGSKTDIIPSMFNELSGTLNEAATKTKKNADVKKSHVEAGYHCTVCSDPCVPCHHREEEGPLKMEKLGLDPDVELSLLQEANPQKARKLSIERSIQSLTHANQCRDTNCRLPSCQNMKNVIAHTKICKRKTLGNCSLCKNLIALCCYHAKHCQETKCFVPFCRSIKQKLKKQQVQESIKQSMKAQGIPTPVPSPPLMPTLGSPPLSNPVLYALPHNEKKALQQRPSMAPLAVRLKLVKLVQKHEIIWENRKEKDKVRLEEAWKKIKKALKVKDVNYCKAEWRKLRTQYIGYVKRNGSMKKELVDSMAFLEAQVRGSPGDTDKSKDESMISEPVKLKKAAPATPKATPKPKKVNTRQSSGSEGVSNDQQLSVALINHLFDSVPPGDMAMVRNALVSVFIKLKPELYKEVIGHAQKHVDVTRSIKNIDWSGLSADAVICNALWDFNVNSMVVQSLQNQNNHK